MPKANEILEIVSQVSRKPVESLTAETTLDSINWDSLCNLEFISILDSDFNLVVNSDNLNGARSVQDLLEIADPK